jgi:hypothetical protein
MIVLYNPGGSQEVELVGEDATPLWPMVRDRVIHTLRLSSNRPAADFLEEYPFSLWWARNSFGDEFQVLYLNADLETFVKLKTKVEMGLLKSSIWAVAKAFDEVANIPIRFVVAEMAIQQSDDVQLPHPESKSANVRRALSDFEALVRSGGPVSGFDRLHAALHGYLLELCQEIGFTPHKDATLVSLFSELRNRHPKLQVGPNDKQTTSILRALASVLEAINIQRNQNSLAHGTNQLLDEAEAMLSVNAVRSLFSYLATKTS